MTLTASDAEDIDRLAAECAELGKHAAGRVYHRWANQHGWFMRPQWIPGRTAFRAAHKRHRAAYTASVGQAELGDEWREELRARWQHDEWAA
jgi:hypothetical protein